MDDGIMREGPLCWTQRSVWLDHCGLPPEARGECNIAATLPLPAGIPAESVITALDTVVARHEGLRTTFHPSGDGDPTQRVHPPRTLPIRLHDVGPDERDQLVGELREVPFDLENEWPVRAALIGGAAGDALLALVVHHICVDGWSMRRLLSEIRELLAGDGIQGAGDTCPLDLTAFESSDEGAAVHARAMRYWQEQLAQIPADVFAIRRSQPAPGEPATRRVALASSAAAPALTRLARRHRAWSSVVATAAFAAVLADYAGVEDVGCKLLSTNRHVPRMSAAMNCAFLPVLAHVGLRGTAHFGDLVERTRSACFAALANSYCAYDDALASRAAESRRRGAEVGIGVVFNFREATALPGSPPADRTVSPPPAWRNLNEDLNLLVVHAPAALYLDLTVRSRVMSAADAEAFVRAMADLMVRQDEFPDDPWRESVPSAAPPARGMDDEQAWRLVDGSWVNLSRVRACIAACERVGQVGVFAEEDGLVAYVTADGGELTAADLRTFTLGRMYEYDAVVCPRWFVICAGRVDDPESPSAWRARPVLARGPGTDGPPVPARTPAEVLLRDTVARVNGLGTDLDMSADYLGCGGSLPRIPGLLRELERKGYTGVGLYDVAGVRPLSRLAAMLRRTP